MARWYNIGGVGALGVLMMVFGCGFAACAEGHVFRGRWISDAEMAAQAPRPVAARRFVGSSATI